MKFFAILVTASVLIGYPQHVLAEAGNDYCSGAGNVRVRIHSPDPKAEIFVEGYYIGIVSRFSEKTLEIPTTEPAVAIRIVNANGEKFERQLSSCIGFAVEMYVSFPAPKPQPLPFQFASARPPVVAPRLAYSTLKYENVGSLNDSHRYVHQVIDELVPPTGLDKRLVHAMASVESSFNPQAVSSAGAQGVWQLMPATAARFGVQNAFDPRQNLEGALKYLTFLYQRFGNRLDLILIGYYAGEGTADEYRDKGVQVSEGVQDYVATVLARYAAEFQ